MGATHVGPLALLDPSCLTSFRVLGFFWAFYSLCFQCEAVVSACLRLFRREERTEKYALKWSGWQRAMPRVPAPVSDTSHSNSS